MIFLHILNISVIMGLIFYLRYTISDKPYSLVLSLFFFIITFGKTNRGTRWFYKNPIYVYHMFLILVLLLINLTLMGQLIKSDILTRPLFNLILSPIAWLLVLITKHLASKPKKDIV